MPVITMYATRTCPHCQRALAYLKDHEVDNVRIVFVDQDELAADEFHRKGFTGVSAFATPDDQWQGFDPARLAKVLSLQSPMGS